MTSKKITITILFFIIWGFCQAGILIDNDESDKMSKARYMTSGDGLWTDSNNWLGNEFPSYDQTSPNDYIHIYHNIYLGNDLQVKSGTFISISANDTLEVNGDVIFNNGSVIHLEVDAVLIIKGDLVNNNNSNQVTIDGKLVIDGNFKGGNGSTIDGVGSLKATGTIKTTGSGSVFGSTDDCLSGDCVRSGSSLPVELIEYEVLEENGLTNIIWTTCSEINNDYFILERSEDLDSFEEIAQIEGAGNSNSVIEYSYVDYNSVSGQSYYRLTQIDFDGTATVYDVKEIFHNSSIKSDPKVEIYPNPVVESANVSLTGFCEDLTVKIYKQDGALVQVIKPDGFEFMLMTKDLSPAIYILQVISDEKVFTQRFVKQ